MKRVIALLCCVLMAAVALPALAEGAAWQLSYYVDEFRLPTDEAYVSNTEMIEGIFSNSATTDSKLNVTVLIDGNGLFFILYEYGDNRVKNSYSKEQLYNITMLDDAWERTSFEGYMLAGDDRIGFVNSAAILSAMQSNTSLSFYIEERDRPTTNYLFTISDMSGLSDALTTLREGIWEKAVELYSAGDYASALTVFASLGDYRDAEERCMAIWRENLIETTRPLTVAAGSCHAVGLKADGTVVAVGSNDYGQCDVSDWSGIVAVFAGDDYTVGLKADGTVVAVGLNDFGQCDVSDWQNIGHLG